MFKHSLFATSALSCLLASLCFPAHAKEEQKYRASVSYGLLDRSGQGQELDANSVSLSLSEKLDGKRTQFFGISGNFADYSSTGTKIDNSAASIMYGQIWKSEHPGLSYFASAFASRSWSDYDVGTVPGGTGTSTKSGGTGVLGGLNQVVPLSYNTLATFGGAVATSYSFIDDMPTSNEGMTLTLTPYAQLSHAITRQYIVYGRMGATISNRDVTLSGKNVLYTPGLGADYVFENDYKLGVQYTHEFANDHRGNRFGLSISRPF